MQTMDTNNDDGISWAEFAAMFEGGSLGVD